MPDAVISAKSSILPSKDGILLSPLSKITQPTE